MGLGLVCTLQWLNGAPLWCFFHSVLSKKIEALLELSHLLHQVDLTSFQSETQHITSDTWLFLGILCMGIMMMESFASVESRLLNLYLNLFPVVNLSTIW